MTDNKGIQCERPLPKGTIIDFCGHRATVVGDFGPDHTIDVACEGMRQTWHWGYEGSVCEVIEMPELECNCGNIEMGFDCTCKWVIDHPGKTHYCCEFCGIYTAGAARCNQCESFEDENNGT